MFRNRAIYWIAMIYFFLLVSVPTIIGGWAVFTAFSQTGDKSNLIILLLASALAGILMGCVLITINRRTPLKMPIIMAICIIATGPCLLGTLFLALSGYGNICFASLGLAFMLLIVSKREEYFSCIKFLLINCPQKSKNT